MDQAIKKILPLWSWHKERKDNELLISEVILMLFFRIDDVFSI